MTGARVTGEALSKGNSPNKPGVDYVKKKLLLTDMDEYLGTKEKVKVHKGSRPKEMIVRYRYPKCIDSLYAQDF